MLSRVNILTATGLLTLAGCGNADTGDEGTPLRTLSSVVILAFVIWLLVHAARKRS